MALIKDAILEDNGTCTLLYENLARAREQFQEIEIQVELEPFEFESYEITGLELKIGGKRYDPTLIGFNPYSGMSTFHGTITLMDPHTHDEAFEKSDLQDTVIVTTPRALDRSVPIPSGRRMYPLIRLNQIAHDHPNARACVPQYVATAPHSDKLFRNPLSSFSFSSLISFTVSFSFSM